MPVRNIRDNCVHEISHTVLNLCCQVMYLILKCTFTSCQVFGLLRFSILLGAVLGITRYPGKTSRRRMRKVRMLILTIAVATWEVTVVKLLVLARFTTNFRLPWFWSLFGWNHVAPFVFYLMWKKLSDMKTARTSKKT